MLRTFQMTLVLKVLFDFALEVWFSIFIGGLNYKPSMEL